MEDLSLDNILDPDEIQGLDLDIPDNNQETQIQDTPIEDNNSPDSDEPVEENPESVDGNKDIEDNQGMEDPSSDEEQSSSNFYSSIANALIEDGVFQSLDNFSPNDIQSPEDFSELVNRQVELQLDERQRRVEQALNYGVEPNKIQVYEKSLETLNSITEEQLSTEDEKGENIRKNIIYQDYINRGFSRERALKEVDKSIKAGNDIEDAKEALNSNKEFFQNAYNNTIEEARQQQQAYVESYQQEAKALQDDIMNTNMVFQDIPVSKAMKNKIYENLLVPCYRDEQGNQYTEIQKYQIEHKQEFLKYIGTLFTLTDGFKNIDKLISGKISKERKKGLKDLENVINSTSRNSDGSLRFTSGVSDPNSKISKWDLDV